MVMEGHTIHLCGIEVEFPFQPYPCQLAYMEKVILSLQKNTNAILESPTGTGKTLCLLCATLAWRDHLIGQLRQQAGENLEGVADPWGTGNVAAAVCHAPKIIYASRTHSQLSQVIHELKNTKYRPKVTIIGSREQLCIHAEVSKKETNSEKVHLCRAKVKNHSCFYYNNTDVRRLQKMESVMDIEDLVLTGSRQRMCPYYLARELKSQADVIFMPYNYILDIKTRQLHGIDVEGTVVILDEAHNIERVCEDSASFDLNSADITLCVGDVTYLLNKIKSSEEEENDLDSNEDFKDFLNLKQFFLTVEGKLDEIALPESGKRETVKPGPYIYEFFATAGLDWSTYGTLLDQLSKAISHLTTDSHRNGNAVQKFVDAVKIVFSSASAPAGPVPSHQHSRQLGPGHHYKVYIKSEEKSKKSDSWDEPGTSTRKEVRTLSYWCFSPGHAMMDLIKQGVRSVILTSGTLSPLDSFSSELQIDFPIRYEGPHVISEKQICVGVVSKGCDGVTLNSSYANRSTAAYQTSLGNTLVNFTRCVPHGLLVFFPSYVVMHGCIDFWRDNGILRRIELHKPVFLEPRRKAEFNPTMDAFYEKIADPAHRGAAFFAVCRGKVSEGLDFADVNGRAVVITGLPFPPRMDPKVMLKMQYLQSHKQASKGLGGEEWYRQQASRAVNQAVGRVIRHKLDYGAILLCDERFCYPNAIDQLPQWVRPHVKTYNKFGMIQRDLNLFFKNATMEFGTGEPKTQSPSEDISDMQESSSVRLPIVMKERVGSYSRALKSAQDASVVDVHLPSSTVPRASLKKLKAEAAKAAASKSLLSSLEQSKGAATQKRVVDVYTPSELVTAPPSSESFSTSIMKGAESRHQVALPAPSTSRAADAPPPHKKIVLCSKKEALKTVTVKGYLRKVQDTLSDVGFQKFKRLMFSYKKERDIRKFVESLKDIFGSPSLYHLLEGISTFLLDEHREAFATFYSEFTGKPLTKGGVALGVVSVKGESKDRKEGISVGPEKLEGSGTLSSSGKLKHKIDHSSSFK